MEIHKGPYIGIVSRHRGGWIGEWGLASAPIGSLKGSYTPFEWKAVAKAHVERQLAKLATRKKAAKKTSKKKRAKKRIGERRDSAGQQSAITAALKGLR